MFSILIKKNQRCGAFGLLWEDTVDNVYNEFLHDTKPKYRYYWKLLMEVSNYNGIACFLLHNRMNFW